MGGMNSNADLYTQIFSYRSNAAPSSCMRQPWFICTRHPLYYPRYGCSIEPLICGEEVFARIARDLEYARRSVDIITWGFDPGMVLVRGATAEDGMRYGDLLKKISTRDTNPVKVRLLVWHDDFVAHEVMKNNAGYYGTRFAGIDCLLHDYYSEAHQTYNAEWYSQACANGLKNICLHVRDIPTEFVDSSLIGELVPTNLKATVSKIYPSHHQKMVLIDYEIPRLAKGYVMGHNSTTDYWDTKEHRFQDKRRERFYSMEPAKLQKNAWSQGQNFDAFHFSLTESQRRRKEALVQEYIDSHSHVAKPYQDVSCRLRGPILYDLNHNFCQAWKESKPPSSLFKEFGSLYALPTVRAVREIGNLAQGLLHFEMDPGFIERRNRLRPDAFEVPYHHAAQLLRTQPLHGEKAIKECYANLTRQMQHYMFIQNQYVQYKPWAEHLLECVGRLRAEGYLKPIYVFLLTSTPESNGMDLPTYDVASRIGKSETMRVEHQDALEQARKEKTKPPITAEELAAHGINVFMGSMWTCADVEGELRPTDYEEIYIHAKVAIVDDAAFTIGSANLNLRSMALDSELNVLSEAKDVAYQLRTELFAQCTGQSGPAQFGYGKNFQRLGSCCF
jgi:phosphatidylserine/phosphatidylglycerophosphate/cardiolipin synthase-like enzyme